MGICFMTEDKKVQKHFEQREITDGVYSLNFQKKENNNGGVNILERRKISVVNILKIVMMQTFLK